VSEGHVQGLEPAKAGSSKGGKQGMRGHLLATAAALAFVVVTPAMAQSETASTSAPPEDAQARQQAETQPIEQISPTAEQTGGDIIVTATRRSERLQDVPLAISVFQQETMSEKGLVGYEDLARETPGIVVNKPTANFNNFTARGIATNGYGANLAGTVAIYIDELPISANGNSTILDPTLFDVERVEFLRGPQGTLFGANSLAGAMRIITKAPNLNRTEAAVLVDLGLTDGDALRQRCNGMINVPLVNDKLAFRAVGFARHEEGWVDNIGTGVKNANTLRSYGGRASLLLEPQDGLSVRLTAMHENNKPKDSGLINPKLGDYVRRSDRPDQFYAKLTSFMRPLMPTSASVISPARRPMPTSTNISWSISPAPLRRPFPSASTRSRMTRSSSRKRGSRPRRATARSTGW
jgi:outer membrane receptor protein involved in Fe transport